MESMKAPESTGAFIMVSLRHSKNYLDILNNFPNIYIRLFSR